MRNVGVVGARFWIEYDWFSIGVCVNQGVIQGCIKVGLVGIEG